MGLSVLTLARTLPDQMLGGMEESTWSLARTLSRLGVDQTILTTSFDGLARMTVRDGIAIHEVPYITGRMRARPPYRWWPHFGRAAGEYARREGLAADIIHSQSLYVDGVLRWRRRPPIVATLHGTPKGDYLGGARDNLVREVGRFHPRVVLQYLAVTYATMRTSHQLRSVESIVPVSRHVAEMLPGIGSDDPRVSIIPNGIDPTDFPWVDHADARAMLGLSDQGPVLLYVGRMDVSKRLDSLLDVVARIPNSTLLVAGDGPYLAPFQDLLRHHPAGPRTRTFGRVRKERPVLYAAADLFCLPSKNEGQPISALEAMAMGTPVATTRPWIPEDLLPYAAIDPDPTKMVEKGLALSKDVDRRKLREQVLSRFTWDHIARSYLDVFLRLHKESA